ncbi:glycoside hydrolase family 3 C-terminal domain-containing protein [Rathayibacter oskolensis]|uniref:glycoside hydrolase family 3 C-terminal domain-containing protein n=1 Tax=Rathayibacter oskolensis TaxID=1891671 RepID=UPI00265E1158|nr:glycoside hydrolase family 3 C-terminal domain-containing protein [Rathayibacter oskolensis]WKK72590.1 glycoside hydrolase family 3 C-terminal domain-containing protein [Rathayibacter oskolensis]
MTHADQLDALTLEEKASLTSGGSFWATKPVDRLGIPSVVLTDGPHGVRLQRQGGDHLGLADSVPATCFPPAVALGSSWDVDLVRRVGVALGEEAKAEGVGVLLGPGINIKRSPLCGRNFEYFSEDPLVSGVMGSALVGGLQSQGVGASLKHFAANNQETDRLRVSADVDERPLREIYLRAFQRVVTEQQPWTVMCSYNRINGVYASEDPWLLTRVLRDEWGFEGLVMSDWGAVNDRVAGVAAGLDLEMPSSGGRTDAQLVAAVAAGELDEEHVSTAARRSLALLDRIAEQADPDASYDADAHHALAREAASRSIVLLQNEGGLLPLDPARSIAVIGEFARTPRYQGAGSSLINPTRLDTALDELRRTVDAAFAPGFTLDGSGDAAALRDEAVAAARGADVVVLFLGLPAAEESEGFDREHLELPVEQTLLLDAVISANPDVVVVLSNGGVVRTSGWQDRVPAIVEGWLLGQAGGGALADVLTGAVNPSGRLTETIPLRLEDSPSHPGFPGAFGHVRYGEDVFVGYRGFDARALEVAFPFGHGLSYTDFSYSGLSVEVIDGGLRLRVDVANTGERDGREVVQVYTGLPGSAVPRAIKALTAFAVVEVVAGETATVAIDVPRDDLAYFHPAAGAWTVEGGDYRIEVGASSRDLRVSTTVAVAGDELALALTEESTVAEWLEHPRAGSLLRGAFASGDGAFSAMFSDPEMLRMLGSMPLRRIAAFPGSPLDEEALAGLVAAAGV